MFVEGAQIQVTASIGLARLADCADEEAALRQSDVALYAAKRAGRNGFAWFDEELEREITERLKLEEDIRRGIKAGEFVPFFQPLVDLDSAADHRFRGARALALADARPARGGELHRDRRAHRPDRSADAQRARAGAEGSARLAGAPEARGQRFAGPVPRPDAGRADPEAARQRRGFPANRLEVEITEGSLLEDRDQVLTIIHSLKNVGVSISLDDFGTGYASLAQVNRLPLDRIKIDKSFITTIVKSEQTAAIVNTIAGLGHNLDVPITAEGVESEQIRNALADFGCSEAQGWLFGRAISAEAVRSFLAMQRAQRTAASPAKARSRALAREPPLVSLAALPTRSWRMAKIGLPSMLPGGE